MSFQAKIKLGLVRNAPLTHTGIKGRVIKKGDSFTTTSKEEAVYYRAQPGFVVTVLKGKLPIVEAPEEPEELDEDVEETDDDEEDERKPKVSGAYEKADLKKMSRDDLRALVKDDDDLPLSLRDIPKKAGKKEIINLILDAQSGSGDDEEDE